MNNKSIFKKPEISIIKVIDADIIKTSNEAYVSWWEEDQLEEQSQQNEN